MTFTPQTEWKLGVRISTSIRMHCILSTSQTCVLLYAHYICRSARYFLKRIDWVFQQGGACAICLRHSELESNWWLLLYAILFLCCLSFPFTAYNLRKTVVTIIKHPNENKVSLWNTLVELNQILQISMFSCVFVGFVWICKNSIFKVTKCILIYEGLKMYLLIFQTLCQYILQ